jgi:LmbE family N-acetylglucosaminyl deacetylase
MSHDDRVTTSRPLCLILSPHLDDAVLSCGAMMSAQVSHMEITVASIFTEASPPPFSMLVKSSLRRSGTTDPLSYYTQRRSEDAQVLATLGVNCVHLGFSDAPFRRRGWAHGTAGARLGRLVPGLVHCYPTYKWDIARGRIARGDRATITTVARSVTGLIARSKPDFVLAPLAVGGHVDHIIVRQIAATQDGVTTLYYEDYPYGLTSGPELDFLMRANLEERVWDQGLESKASLIKGYGTQTAGLFPSGIIEIIPERYHVPAGGDLTAIFR